MQLKYFGSKAWLAPHMDRLLGDVAVLHSPFFGSGKLEYYLAARRPGLEVRGVDAFEPVANLHRCYLRRDPVFLRSLLRLVGRRVDRRFYSGRLLPGALRGRAGRRAACAYVLLRSFAQQRLLALSSVRRLQQPPCNVTVRHQDALAYLRALPCLAHQCIYADPPYIFPGRSMNYYGTRGGHDLVFHTELRDALFASAALRRQRQRRARGPGALQRGRLHHKPALGEEQFQARAARDAPGQSCCQHRNG